MKHRIHQTRLFAPPAGDQALNILCSEWLMEKERSLENKTPRKSICMMTTNSWCVALLALALTLPGIANADVLDYAVTLNNELGTIDLQTGAFTQLGTVVGISAGSIGDLARLPGGLLYGINGSSELVLIDPVALTTSVVGDSGNRILGLAFRPDGTLFGASLHSALYTINPNTGTATLVAALTGDGTGFSGIYGFFDIKFDNTGNYLYLLSNDTLYTINTSNGQTTLVGAIGFGVYALDLENGTLYGFTDGGKIISINTTTGAGVVVATQSQASPIIAASTGGVSVGKPYLTIQLTNINSAAFSWIAPSNAFRLQQNPELTTTNWASVTNSVSVTNSQNQVIVSPAVGNNFYRLVSP